MNAVLRKKCEVLRSLCENEAYDWLLAEYPPHLRGSFSEAMNLIPRRSWTKSTQVKLAKAYWPFMFPAGIPKALDAFAPFMAPKTAADTLRELFGSDEERMALIRYHLPYHVAGYVKSDAEKDDFIRRFEGG